MTSEWSPKIESVGGDGTSGNVQDKRHQLTGQFVQRGDHQQ
jgi:hypothetical protein